jgi:hypothetical protein
MRFDPIIPGTVPAVRKGRLDDVVPVMTETHRRVRA